MFECVRENLVIFSFCFQAEDGIRYLVRSRGLGDVYKRQESIALDAADEVGDDDPLPDGLA